MSGVSLSTKEPAVADRLVLASDELTLYHGQPTQLTRFVRVLVGGATCRLYLEELSPAEDQAYMLRHYDFVAQQQAAQQAIAKAEDAKRKAKDAAAVAQQMTQHNMAILAQLSQEADRRSVLLAEKATLQDKYAATLREHAETVARMQAAQQDMANLAAAQAATHTQQMDSLRQQIAVQQDTANGLSEQVARSAAQLSSLQGVVAQLQAVVKSKDAQIATLEQQVQLQTVQISAYEEDRARDVAKQQEAPVEVVVEQQQEEAQTE